MIKRPIHLSHDFLAQVLDDESVAVDATMGNGNDTAFLAGLAQKVYAFDVQEQALEKTRQRLSDLEFEMRTHLDGPKSCRLSRTILPFFIWVLPSSLDVFPTPPFWALEICR
jgi:Trans-aconitate methyltransferase